MVNKIKETTMAPDTEIASNILNLAKHRPDIFGSVQGGESSKTIYDTESENFYHPKNKTRPNYITSIQEHVQKSPQPSHLDKSSLTHFYHTMSKSSNTKNRERKTIIKHLCKPHIIKTNQKNDNTVAREISSKYSGPQLIHICIIPPHKNRETGYSLILNVQSLEITVKSLKDRLTEMINFSIPKQELTVEGIGVLKDQNSLAFYNIEPKTVLKLIHTRTNKNLN